MSNLSRSIAAVAVAAAAFGAIALPASAQAYGHVPGYGGQTYSSGAPYGAPAYGPQGYYGTSQGYSQPSYNDAYRCDRERQGRTGAGAVIGGGLGAVVGSQLAARGRRTEGSILGGVLGAVVGGSVGRGSSDACSDQGSYAYGQSSYRTSDYGSRQPYSSGHGSANVYYDENGYGPYAADDRRYEDRRHGDRRRDDRQRDGRYYRRDLQVSPDGRYVYDPNYGWVPR